VIFDLKNTDFIRENRCSEHENEGAISSFTVEGVWGGFRGSKTLVHRDVFSGGEGGGGGSLMDI
jgi:hypothetical protein